MIRLTLGALALCAQSAFAEVILSFDEIARTLSFGPWPPAVEFDPSNRVSGNEAAIALGAAFFNDTRLSVDGAFSCAHCHDPERNFSTPLARAKGREMRARNSPSVMNLSGLRWFGWGGKSDSLWAASLHPIINQFEMGHTANTWRAELSSSIFARDYEAIFGAIAQQTAQEILVNSAKALAAYQETLITPKSTFDEFRDALERDDFATAGRYATSAQRGLKLFLGRANCSTCHGGAHFTNNEFHDAGVPYFLSDNTVDAGRFAGLKILLSSPYTLDGEWSDDPDKNGAWAVRNVRQNHADFGAFRTPSLRGVAGTSPYMHDGSLVDLEAVVRHYNDIDLERMHSDGEAILKPLNLTKGEMADLVRFLETLGP